MTPTNMQTIYTVVRCDDHTDGVSYGVHQSFTDIEKARQSMLSMGLETIEQYIAEDEVELPDFYDKSKEASEYEYSELIDLFLLFDSKIYGDHIVISYYGSDVNKIKIEANELV